MVLSQLISRLPMVAVVEGKGGGGGGRNGSHALWQSVEQLICDPLLHHVSLGSGLRVQYPLSS